MSYVRRWYQILIVISMLIGMLPSIVYSQNEPPITTALDESNIVTRLYMPLVRNPQIYPEITRASCTDRGFEISSAEYPNGTSFITLIQHYMMNGQDFLTANPENLFPGGVISVFDGESRVCLPKSYNLLWNSTTGFYAKLNNERTDWQNNLQFGTSMNIADNAGVGATEEFILTTPVFPITGELFEIVGEWFNPAGTSQGWLAKVAPGSRGSLLLKGVGKLAGYIPVVLILGNTNINAVTYPATGLAGGAYVFYYSVLPATGKVYFGCYTDGITRADRLKIGEIIQMVVYEGSGTNLTACLLTSILLSGSVGSESYPWVIAQHAAVEMAVSKKAVDDAALIIADLEEYYERKDTGDTVVVDPTYECPEIDALALWDDGVALTQMAADYMMQNINSLGEERVMAVVDLAFSAGDYPYTEDLEDWYKTPRKRYQGAVAMVTTQNGRADLEGFHYNLNVSCQWSTARNSYVWFPDLTNAYKGIADSGMTRSDPLLHYFLRYLYTYFQ